MTVRDLDNTIEKVLTVGPSTASEIYATVSSGCSQYDVNAALSIWLRNGWVRKSVSDGRMTYTLTENQAGR